MCAKIFQYPVSLCLVCHKYLVSCEKIFVKLCEMFPLTLTSHTHRAARLCLQMLLSSLYESDPLLRVWKSIHSNPVSVSNVRGSGCVDACS